MSTHRDIQSLVDRAKRGDREAFETLVRLYRDRLDGVIRKRLGAALARDIEAADVLQETMLRAFGAMNRFEWRDEASFFRWLSGIAIKVILEAANRRNARQYISLEFEVASAEPSPSRTVQREERFERFEKAIEELSPDHRTALRLVRLEGLSVTEAARRMKRSPNAVSHLLIRGLRKLRENFGETASFHLQKPTGAEGTEAGSRNV